jgi:hypothetical protein
MLIQAPDETAKSEIFGRFQDLFIVRRDQNLYAQFGAPEIFINALEELKKYRTSKEQLFKKLTSDTNAIETVRTLLDQIMDSAQKTAYLPDRVQQNSREDLGTEMEISQEVQVEVSTEQFSNRELEQELNRELEQELKEYQNLEVPKIIQEHSWTDLDVASKLKKANYLKFDTSPRCILFERPLTR